MTLGRRHLRGTTQIAANAAALKNLFNVRHPPEFLPEAPGRPSKTVCKPFFQRTKGSLFCAFSDYSHQSLLIIFNYNRFIITATKAFVKKEKAGGEKRNSARPFGLVYEEILGIAKNFKLLLRYRSRQHGVLFLFFRGVSLLQLLWCNSLRPRFRRKQKQRKFRHKRKVPRW